MNTRLARIALAAGTLVTGLLVAAPAATAATTFTVTSSSCSGAGSWQAAIQAANAHPGTDIIDVQTDMADLYVGNCAGTSVPGNIFAGHITDSVTINGNGHVMRGDPTWVASDGTLNPNGACPSKVHGTILLDTPAAAFEVGVKNSDNSAVSVAVNDLTVQGANSLLLVRDNAHVALDGVHAKGLTDLLCSRPAIESQTGASLSINNSSFDSGINWEPALNGVGSSLILGGPGSLSIHRTTFTNNTYPGAITWDVSGGKIANIVSSQLSTSGGIMVLGDGSANMVNSIVDMGSLGSRDVTDRVVADSGATVTLTASTVKASGALCQSSPIIGGCAVTPDGYLVAAGGGSLHLVQSAVGTGVTDDTAARSQAGRYRAADSLRAAVAAHGYSRAADSR